ncbi:MAG: FIST N-terminal domain-containing protein, partial [Desulfomonilia bacterium]
MPIQTFHSTSHELKTAVNDIQKQAASVKPALVIYFASSSFDQAELARELRGLFPSSPVVGCSTAGEIVSGHMLKGSVVVMTIGRDVIAETAVEVVEKVGTENRIPQALGNFEKRFGVTMSAMDPSQYIGLILIDGLSGAEERLMDKLGDLTNVFFVGGSAGDDLKFKNTFVCSDGKAYEDAAILVLMKPAAKFDIIKTQSFVDLGKTLTATKVDTSSRKVLEFNGKPAVETYAEALGVRPEELEERFMTNPLGLMVEGEPFVRSPQKTDGTSIVFYCNILEGMELNVLESTDIVKD